MAATTITHWQGEYSFLLKNLLLKDFRVRYRNMSLGFLWSVANPLVMMGVLTFIFTKIFVNTRVHDYPVFVMCGLVPFNFFSIAWVTGTTSLVDNGNLVKRLSFPREIIPISTVLANVIHFAIQLSILVVMALIFREPITVYWLYVPIIAAFLIVFACGVALIFSAINVYIRDTRYVVESANTVLFWLVPIFYSFEIIPQEYKEVYRFNPVAAVVMLFRNILLDHKAPETATIVNLVLCSLVSLAVGLVAFRSMKKRLFDYV